MTSPFTCITCRVAFEGLEIQRSHYKSDWHRYNLLRKVVELPHVTAEEFKKRVISQRQEDEKSGKEDLYCKFCRKHFNTRNQYENHLSSKKHKEKSLKHQDNPNEGTSRSTSSMEIESDVESVDSDDWIDDTDNPIKHNNCLFCDNHSKSLVKNLKHMTIAHSFFIPDPDYCTNIRGLLSYLGEKIFAGYMCIWCNDSGKAFHSSESAKSHMIDKGHCKMLHEGEALMEYSEFYDYSSSYPDQDANVDSETEVQVPVLDDTDYQLILPSGAVIGHRSLMRYYKQNLNPTSTTVSTKREKLQKIISQYRALGWNHTQKEIVVRKARDIKYMQRVNAKYSTQLGVKANKLQHHFRKYL